MRLKRAGILTKVVVLVLLIYITTSLLDMRGKIQDTQSQRDALESQVTAQQLENQALQAAIENSDDPEVLESVARSKGYIKEGETLFVDGAG